MRFLGAKVVLTPAAERGIGMVNKAQELAKRTAGSSPASSRTKPIPTCTRAPPRARSSTTSRASGSTTGSPASAPAARSRASRACCAKERPDTKIVVCEPADAPMLDQRAAGAQCRRLAGRDQRRVQAAPDAGLEPGLRPKLTGDAVDAGVIERVLTIAGADAMNCSRELAQKEGIFVGISAGGTFAGALEVCKTPRPVDRARHAARHRRALPDDAAVRRHRGRHDRGRTENFQLDAQHRMPPKAA